MKSVLAHSLPENEKSVRALGTAPDFAEMEADAASR